MVLPPSGVPPDPCHKSGNTTSRPGGIFLEVPTLLPCTLAILRGSEPISPQRAIPRTGASSIANAPNKPKRSNFIEFYKKPMPIQSGRDGRKSDLSKLAFL